MHTELLQLNICSKDSQTVKYLKVGKIFEQIIHQEDMDGK